MKKGIIKFEEIIAWQKARKLHQIVNELFGNNKNYSFKDQIKRASISISNNIAEGFERRTHREFIAFLYIAKGSSAEVRSMLYSALDLNYISQKQFNEALELTKEVSRLIVGFINSLK